MFLKFVRSFKTLIIFYSIIILVISSLSFYFYESEKEFQKNHHQSNLTSISQLKYNQIIYWYNDILGDAEMFFLHKPLHNALQSYLTYKTTKDSLSIKSILSLVYNKSDYLNIFILNKVGKIIFNLQNFHSANYLSDSTYSSKKSLKITTSGFYYDSFSDSLVIDFYIPVSFNSEYISMVVLKIDPYKYLFPLLQNWEKDISTGESLLISGDSDSIIFLSPSKFNFYQPLQFKKPLDDLNLPGAQVVSGSEGIVEGFDYRNKEVIAHIRPLPGSPWYIISKIDIDEVYDQVTDNFYNNLLILSVVLIAGGVFFFFLLYRLRYKSIRQLYDSEENFRSLFQNSNNAIFLFDNNLIIDCNDKAEELFDLSRKKIIGKHHADLSPEYQPDNLKSFEKANQLLASVMNGNSVHFEWLHKKNDSLIYTDINLSSIDLNGKKYPVAFLFDITSHKMAAQALIESEEKFVTTFRHSPIAMTITSIDEGKFIDVNDVFLRDTGFKIDEIIGKTSSELRIFVDDFDRLKFRELISKNKFVYGLEFSFRTKTGTVLDALVSSSVVYLNQQPFLLSSIIDISERKKVENELNKSKALLTSSLEMANMGHWEYDVETDTFLFNDQFYKMMRTSIKDIGSYSISFSDYAARFVHPDDTKLVAKEIQIAIESDDPSLYCEFEHRIIYADGQTGFVAVRFNIIQDKNGKTIRTFGVNQDITVRKNAEEILRENELKLRNIFEHSTNLFYTHDINNVLTYVSPQSEQFFGCDSLEAKKSWTEFLTDNPVNLYGIKITELAFTSGQPQPPYELELKKKNGDKIWVVVHETPVVENGKTVSIVGSLTDITERKLAENTLKKNEEIFRQFLENSPIYIFFKDRDIKATMLSRNYESMLGKPAEEILGKSMDDLFPSELAKSMIEDDKKILNEGKVINVKEELNGRFFSTTKFPIIIDGKPEYLAGYTIDITQEKIARDALIESEVHFRNLADSGQALVWTSGTDKKCNYFNKIWLDFTGRTLEQEIGDGWAAGVHPDDLDCCIKIYTESFDKKVNFSMDYRIRRFDGEYRWIQDDGSPRYNSKGEFLGFIGHCLDITERKLMEEQLINTLNQLKNLHDNLPEAIFSVDLIDNKMLQASPAHLQVFGYQPQDFFNNPDLWYDITLPEDKHSVDSNYKVLTEGKILKHQFRILFPSGEINWIEAKIKPTLDETGRLIRIDGMASNITERKKSEDTLKVKLYMDKVLSEISNLLLTDDNENNIINKALAVLGHSSNTSRAYIFNIDEDSGIMNNVFEWCSEGTKPMINNLQNLHLSRFPWWMNKLYGNEPIIVSDVSLLPQEAAAEKVFLQRQSIRSLLVLPMFYKGILKSFIGFDDVTNTRHWKKEESNILKYASERINSFIIRTKTEAELKESESRYRKLFQDHSAVKLIIDPDTLSIVDANKSASAFYGWSPDELKSMKVSELSTNSYSVVKSTIEDVSVNSKTNLVSSHRTSNGSIIDVEIFSSVIEFQGKKLIHSIIQDITARKKAEKYIKTLIKAIEQSPVSVIITDPDGSIQYVNNKFTEATGYSLSEIKGQNPKLLKSGSHSLDFYKNLWKTILAGNTWQGELQNKKKNGELLWENAIISPIVDEKGRLINFIAVKEDVTEKKKMIEELISSKEKAEEASRLKSNFLANMSHELRTPMVGILGFAEILERELLDPAYTEMAVTIKKSGTRLIETLNSILDLSRIESNNFDINITKVNLNDILAESINLYKPMAQNKGLFINSILPSDPVYLDSDKEILIKIFNNLINNAVKYTHQGSITIKFVFTNNNSNRFVNVNIIDTGIGIPAGFHEIIFEPFRQVSEGYSRKFEGNGLGLSITKKFIELLNGTISLKSTPGIGSAFSVLLPLKISGKNMINNKSTSYVKNSETDIFDKKPHILLVEDDSVNAAVISAYLKDYVSVDHFFDGSEAVEQCKTRIYDAVLMDINLKGIDGVEALKLIRKIDDNYSTIPVIAVTAYAMNGDREKFLSFGFDHYLSKPFQRSQLLMLLSAIFKNK